MKYYISTGLFNNYYTLRQHVTALMERFDSVQILASNSTDIGTENVFLGAGNWFARQGMAHDFINKDRAQTEAHELAGVIRPAEDD